MARPPIPSNFIYIGLALVLAVITSILVGQLAKKPEVENVKMAEIETVPILVATQQILPGQRISPQDVKTIDWPAENAPDPKFSFTNREDVLNRVVRESIYPSEPILALKLAGETSRGGLPVVIPEGKRAVTVSVTEVKGVAGFVKPGSWVDVISTMEIPNSGGDSGGDNITTTKTVLQNVQVLAIAQEMTPKPVKIDESLTVDEDDDVDNDNLDEEDIKKLITENNIDDLEGPAKIVKSVTLALSPGQTQTAILADEVGNLRLVLRAELDESTSPVASITHNQLAGGYAPAPQAVATPQGSGSNRGGTPVEFYDGNDRQVVRF